jgi:Xaa-Pro aminopeptidase
LLVTKLENIAYLTGFSGSAAMLLITKDSAVFVSDGRYRDQAEQQLCANGIDATIVIGAAAKQMESLVLAVPPGARLGLEDRDVTWSFLTRATKEFTNPIVATAGCIEELRVIKDAGEIDRIERACSIADQALAEVKTRLVERPSEAEFAAELEFAMRRFGSSGVSFETIVASGERGAFPHARPTGRVVNEGDLVVVDFGAMVDGYHSDMTRTFIVGPPSDEQRTHYEAVQIAQQAGVDAVRAGVAASEVDRACRDQLDALGFGDYFTHGTGHGVGREIHEAPSVGGRVTDSLSVGMVVTVEPGVYLPGVGGVRIEDTLVVTNDGTRTLTKSTKDYQL